MQQKQKLQKQDTLSTILDYHTWRISNQILCFAILLLGLITTLIYVLTFLLLNYTISTLKTSSELSLQVENRHQIQRFTQLQAYSSQEYFKQHSQQLRMINQLFLFNQVHNVQTVVPPPYLNKTEVTDEYALSSYFCYSYFGNGIIENVYSDQQMKKLSATLAEYLLEFDLTGQLYYCSISSDQFFANYNNTVEPSYRPKQRQWYQDHLKKMKLEEIIMSDPYFSGSNIVVIAFSYNLSDFNGQLLGIVGEDYDFEVMPKVKDDKIKVSMVDSKDQLIISRLYEVSVSTIFHIYDQQLTGISKIDWENMKKQVDKNGWHLIYDEEKKYDTLISIQKINWPEIYIVLEIDNEIYVDSYLRLINKYEKFQSNYNFFNFFYLIIIIFICLLCQFSFIKWLQKDLNTLKYIAYKSVYQDYFKFQSRFNSPISNPTINNLQLAFLRIIDNQNGRKHKNLICSTLEQFKYNFRSKIKYKRTIKKIFTQNKQLHDYQTINHSFPITNIFLSEKKQNDQFNKYLKKQ